MDQASPSIADAAAPAAGVPNPADPYLRAAQTFPCLTPEQVARAMPFGAVESLPGGTVLFSRGERSVDFFLVLEGAIEIYEDAPDGAPRVFTVHGERQFTGELDLFNDREILVGGRIAAGGGRVLRLSRPQFRRLLAAEPDIAEIIMRAYILRRIGLIEHAQGAVTLLAARRGAAVGDGLRVQRFLGRNGYPVRLLDAEAPGGEGALMLDALGLTAEDLPVVFCGPGKVLRNPANRELADCLGIAERLAPEAVFDLVVIGAGPAGLAAAVYGASEGLRTLVLEAEAPGGQAGTSSKIENYLGFPTGISGAALAGRAQVQAQKFGARIALPRAAARLEPGAPHRIHLSDGEVVQARTVVIATGARYRRLDGLPEFDRLEGHGIHYAATAAEAALCENEEVVVVGGGNSAGQAAVYLSRRARCVHMLVRGEGLAASMSEYLIARIEASDRIRLLCHSEVAGLSGARHLERVRWRHRRTGESEERPVANLFLMLGALPNTGWLAGSGVALDGQGFVRVGAEAAGPAPRGRPPHALETSVPGIFAVGDVRAGSVKRVASSVGEGSVVVSAVHQVLAEAR